MEILRRTIQAGEGLMRVDEGGMRCGGDAMHADEDTMHADEDTMQIVRIPLATFDGSIGDHVLIIEGNNNAVVYVSFEDDTIPPQHSWCGIEGGGYDVWDLDPETGYPPSGIVVCNEGVLVEDTRIPEFSRRILQAVHLWERGDIGALSALEPVIRGTELQMACYRALLELKPGELITYSQLAARIGHPGAVRAVAHACAINPMPLLVPCHRVIPAAGARALAAGKCADYGDYVYGWQLKRALIEFEAYANAKCSYA